MIPCTSIWVIAILGTVYPQWKWGFCENGVAPNGWFISWKIILIIDDLGVPQFRETSIYVAYMLIDHLLTALEAHPRKAVYVCREADGQMTHGIVS